MASEELKWDEGVTWRAELKNSFGKVVEIQEGARQVVESRIRGWIPILIAGDTIQITQV